MPVFAENWPSLIMVFLALFITKKLFFKTQKVSIVSSILIFVYCAIFALPFQSFCALKFWKLSDAMVLHVVFPVSAFITTFPTAYLCLKIHLKITSWWQRRKHMRAELKAAA